MTATAIPPESNTRSRLKDLPLEEKIQRVIDEWSRPFMRSEGGDLSIERISDKIVYVRLHGVCAGCASAGITLQFMVEQPLQSFVDPDIRVIPV
jgi:Fe-S cluster biogenesis protein NfuA